MARFFMVPYHIFLVLVALSTTTLTIAFVPSTLVAPPPLQPKTTIPPAQAHLRAPTVSPSNYRKPKPLTSAAKEFLAAHNKARAEVNVAPLKWSDKLAHDTDMLVRYQRDKKNCRFADMSLTQYGMNQMWASGMRVTPTRAVGLWLQSKKHYSYQKNTCAPRHDNCGVYKQVVWKKTLEVGCAQAKCGRDGSTISICFYYPPGNVIGERPY
ncbi:hypothetical protein MKW92_003457 [Papaver armeniacum]|nr:hypothetical protein MKW92_040750 [Papaver armeniacum]KAI3934699.1 hypothetical protein MKW92_003457 [Papaver armeniacum]